MERIEKIGEAKREKQFLDHVFENEMIGLINKAFSAYERCHYKECMTYAWYGMENLRKNYCNLLNDDWHPDCIAEFLRIQTLIMLPILPHFCEQMWAKILKRNSILTKEVWPYPAKEFDKVGASLLVVSLAGVEVGVVLS